MSICVLYNIFKFCIVIWVVVRKFVIYLFDVRFDLVRNFVDLELFLKNILML